MNENEEENRNHMIISHLIGPEGEYFAELGGLETVFCQGLFQHYYDGKKKPKRDTIQKYIRGTAPFPQKITQHYIGENGEAYMRQGIDRLVNACMCIDVLRSIQHQVATYITSNTNVDQSIKNKLSSCYIDTAANRGQIAAYLTCVMVYIIPMI